MDENPLRWALASAVVLLLAALTCCAPQAWERDPAVKAAKRACKDVPRGERYSCVERRAVDTNNPDVCHLVGMWIDDMCLQSVYEAADHAAICDQLYLEEVRPTCRAYYRRPPVDFVTDGVVSVGAGLPDHTIEYRISVIHWGNQEVEDLEAYLILPEAEGLRSMVRLDYLMAAPPDVIVPNRGLMYEGSITWDAELSRKEVGSLLHKVRIHLVWTFEGERHTRLLPLSTEKGPDVFPSTPESSLDEPGQSVG
ncbi:MAG: hypothetical protein PVH50_03045 [Anaerolineae bacterium]|jgi:hypothetical protein